MDTRVVFNTLDMS